MNQNQNSDNTAGAVAPAATCSPSYWQSWAEWPDGLVNNISGEGKNNTVDCHDTEEQAKAVCSMLERNGFGGERIHFPVKTWTVPIYPENSQPTGR